MACATRPTALSWSPTRPTATRRRRVRPRRRRRRISLAAAVPVTPTRRAAKRRESQEPFAPSRGVPVAGTPLSFYLAPVIGVPSSATIAAPRAECRMRRSPTDPALRPRPLRLSRLRRDSGFLVRLGVGAGRLGERRRHARLCLLRSRLLRLLRFPVRPHLSLGHDRSP